MYSRATHNPQETYHLGEWLGQRLQPSDFVALVGEMGAGKTHLSSGILAGLGVTRTSGSPTFTLLWEYQGRLPVYHWDVYRLRSPAELEDLGYEEYFYGDGVNLVEWADLITTLWPDDFLRIDLAYGAGDDERTLTFTGSERYAKLLEDLMHENFSA
jgi:tRNA threonylcarbamoyladenosine biosynthesis protein TsaE